MCYRKPNNNEVVLYQESQYYLEFQKIINYIKEFSLYKRELFYCWDLFLNWSLELGNQHFAITINCPQENFYKYQNIYDISIKDKNIKQYTSLFDKFLDPLINYPKLTTWFFIISEENKNGYIHFHGVLAIRNIVDCYTPIKNNIMNYLKNQMLAGDILIKELDIKIDILYTFLDVKKWITYIHKNFLNSQFNPMMYIIEKYKNFSEKIFINIYDTLNNIIPWILQTNLNNLLRFNEISLDLYIYNIKKSEYDNVVGIKTVDKKITQETILCLILYFIQMKCFFLNKNNIYEKIENTQISYKLVGSIENILYDNFQENIITFFKKNFHCHFNGFDFFNLIKQHKIKNKKNIEVIKDISTAKIEFDFSLMEFTDGIYSIKYNKFIPKKQQIENFKKFTLKYYNKSYNRIRQNKPQNWIGGICKALDVKSENELECNEGFLKIIKAFGLIFQDEKIKKSTLFIYGPSNSGKTTLITEPITNFLGLENIGTIVSTTNFKWQGLFEKVLGIIEEGRYNQSMSSDLLKISGQENIIVEKKYSKEHIEIKPIPLIIISNVLFEDKNENINKALKNRMLVVEFIYTLEQTDCDNKIKEKIKNEESNIMIYNKRTEK